MILYILDGQSVGFQKHIPNKNNLNNLDKSIKRKRR